MRKGGKVKVVGIIPNPEPNVVVGDLEPGFYVGRIAGYHYRVFLVVEVNLTNEAMTEVTTKRCYPCDTPSGLNFGSTNLSWGPQATIQNCIPVDVELRILANDD